jgi:hypothetical protein
MSEGLPFDDARWTQLQGGYRIPFDARPALLALAGNGAPAAWDELWNNLHHQGDVGDASYAAVPYFIAAYAANRVPHWNAYALASTIELARHDGRNPALPDFLSKGYRDAWQKLAELALSEIRDATDPELVRSIIGVLAIWKGHVRLGQIASEYTEDEIDELLAHAWEWEDA